MELLLENYDSMVMDQMMDEEFFEIIGGKGNG